MKPTLTRRERETLKAREAGQSLAAIGQRFGVTKERVRQIEAKALRKSLRRGAYE